MKKNSNGTWSPLIAVSMNNPEKKSKKDWWDEMCKAHGEKNHWKKNKADRETDDEK